MTGAQNKGLSQFSWVCRVAKHKRARKSLHMKTRFQTEAKGKLRNSTSGDVGGGGGGGGGGIMRLAAFCFKNWN